MRRGEGWKEERKEEKEGYKMRNRSKREKKIEAGKTRSRRRD